MIVVFEGVSCAGKTTLIEAVKDRITDSQTVDLTFGRAHGHDGSSTREEITEELRVLHSDLRERRTLSLLEELDYQESYIPLVRARLAAMAEVSRSASWTLAHRDIWSNYVQGDARFRGAFEPGRQAFADMFERLWRALLPEEVADLHVVVAVPWRVFRLRAAGRVRMPHHLLLEEDYFAALSESYVAVAAALGERCLPLDGERPIDELVASVTSWLTERPWHPRPFEETYATFGVMTAQLRSSSTPLTEAG